MSPQNQLLPPERTPRSQSGDGAEEHGSNPHEERRGPTLSRHAWQACLTRLIAAPTASPLHKAEVYRERMVAAATEWNPDPDAHGEVLRRLIKTRMEIARTIGTPPERRMRAQLADALKWRLKGQPPIPLYAAGPLDRRHPASPPMTYTQESAQDDPRYAALHRMTLQRIFSEPKTLSYRSTPPDLRGAAELYERAYSIGQDQRDVVVRKVLWKVDSPRLPIPGPTPIVQHIHADHTDVPRILNWLETLYRHCLTGHDWISQVRSLCRYEWWSYQALASARGGAAVTGTLSLCMQNAIGLPPAHSFESPDLTALATELDAYVEDRTQRLINRPHKAHHFKR